MMLLSDSVGGADESMNGFSNWIPVNFTEVSTAIDRLHPWLCPVAQYALRNTSCSTQLSLLTPCSLFHFVVIFFVRVPNSIEPLTVTSPTPKQDSFHPPKDHGSRGKGTPTFTPTIPAL